MLWKSGLGRVIIGTLSMAVGVLMVAAPFAQADGSGSFNYERRYFNSGRGEVYVERAPRLIYNPTAPPDSYEPNGFTWYANLYSYQCWINWCVPSVVRLDVHIKDVSQTSGREKWNMNRFWPISVGEYGQTVQWTFSINGGNDRMSGGVSATLTGTNVHRFTTNYAPLDKGDGYRRLGYLSIDLAEAPGWQQAYLEGAFKIVIRNGDGSAVKDHEYRVRVDWTISWRNCGGLACWGAENWYYSSIRMGDNIGTGDGYIFVRTGDSNGP